MRRVLWGLALGAAAAWLVRRLLGGAPEDGEHVSVGYSDGTTTVLEVGSPERELLLATAAAAL